MIMGNILSGSSFQ